LIRAIYDISNSKYIYGPLNTVTEIFSNINSVYESKFSFGLIPAESNNLIIETPISAPRVGLNPINNKVMFDSLYRFLIMPKRKHAEKTKIVEGMKLQCKYSENEINEIWG